MLLNFAIATLVNGLHSFSKDFHLPSLSYENCLVSQLRNNKCLTLIKSHLRHQVLCKREELMGEQRSTTTFSICLETIMSQFRKACIPMGFAPGIGWHRSIPVIRCCLISRLKRQVSYCYCYLFQ